jgi:glutathione S-transferase
MSIRFYGWPQSSASQVHWALEELGVPYEYVRLDRSKNEHRAPAYLAINPNGKVPALVDGDQSYFESLAILLHLAERYGQDRGFWPRDGGGDAAERSEALCWAVWGTTELHAYMMQWLYHGVSTPVSYAPDHRSKGAADYNHMQYLRLLKVLDARLSGRDYVCGNFSIADIPAASALLFGTSLGGSVEGHANVEAWLAKCRARPALARVADR